MGENSVGILDEGVGFDSILLRIEGAGQGTSGL